MSDSWCSVRLGDIARVEHGWPFKSEHFSEQLSGRPIVVAIGNFDYSGGFRFTTTKTKEYRAGYPRQYELAPGDIVVVMTCQTSGGEILGIPARVPDDGRMYLHNQRIGKVVVTRPDLVVPEFLYWVFLWRDFNQELVASSSGTKIVHTAPSRIESFRFALPSRHEQRVIARLLWALDDKIALNRRMTRTLEATAAALFQRRFLDLDASGEWREGSIQDLATFVNGRNFTGGATGSGRLVIRIAELNNGPGGSTVYNDVPADPDNIAQPGDLLFSWSGSLGVYRWFRDDGLVNQHIFKVVPHSYPQWFVHEHLKIALPFFREVAAGKATTMGHIKREHLSQVPVMLPPVDVLKDANEVLQPLYDRVLVNARESLKLAALRDALLPQLLSGAVRLREAERLVEVVA